MTETISPPESQPAEDRVLAILNNFASRDMPGRQREIQDCVNKILAKVDSEPAAS